jgi:hypothetical protein
VPSLQQTNTYKLGSEREKAEEEEEEEERKKERKRERREEYLFE